MHRYLKEIALGALLLGWGFSASQAAAPTPPATAQGSIKAKGYLNIGSGTAVTDLTSNPKYPDKPDVIFYEPYFEWNATGDINTPANNAYGDNYGADMQGYFYPPSTGDYTFFVASDDNSNLYLSTDSDPANKKLIAQETGWSNPRSWDVVGGGSTVEAKNSSTFPLTEWATKDTVNGGAKITLQSGQAYYIEAIMKEGGGGDNLAVAVKDPNSAIDATLPIPGNYLSPYPPATTASVFTQPQDALAYAGSTANFAVGLDVPPGVTVSSIKWTKNGTDIPNSNTNALTLPTAATDNNAQIQAIVSTSAGTVTSSNATLTVATISTNFTQGVMKYEVYTGITGTSVDDLMADPNFPNSPDIISVLGAYEAPVNWNDNYGARLSGFITPTQTGNYVFFLSSDDNSNLYLSTDDTPGNKKLIAQETVWSNSREWTVSGGASDLTAKRSDQFTSSEWPGGTNISLTVGKKYYTEVLHKEGGGGDNAAVTWKMAGAPDPVTGSPPLSGQFIGANAMPSLGTPNVTQQPQSLPQLVQGRIGTLTVAGSVSPAALNLPPLIQWQRNGTNIPGATATNLTVTTNATADAGGNYQAVLTAPSGNSVTSSVAMVTYVPDTFAPKATNVAAVGLDAIGIQFDEPVDKTTAETIGNYSIPGVTITSATLDPTGTLVRLQATGITTNKQYTLTFGGVKDLYNNAVAAGTTAQFTSTFFSYSDIILADKPIAYYRFEETSGSVAKNSGSTGGDGQYTSGDEPSAAAGGTATQASPTPGPRPPQFLGFTLDNEAAHFDGATFWVDAKNQFLQNLNAFTLEYWVNPQNRAAWPTRVGLVGQNDAVEYGFIDPNTIQIWTPNGGSLNTTYSFPDGEWHHVATIADGTNLVNYFDGQLVGSGGSAVADPTTGYGSSSYNVHIGGGGVFDPAANWFMGALDEVAIFDKAIPAARVAAHYAAGKNGSGGQGGSTNGPTFTSITLSGGQVTISWATGSLSSSPTVNGTYTPVAGATSPFKVSPTGAAGFYILKP